MSFWNWYAGGGRSQLSLKGMADSFYNNFIRPYSEDVFGYTKYKNTVAANQLQIDYAQYMRQGYQRAYDDWQKNVGSKGRTIRYPELSYPGHINFYDKDVSGALLSNDTARANLYGSLPFRGSGLYSVGTRAFRFI